MGTNFDFDLSILNNSGDLGMATYYEVVNDEGKVGLSKAQRSCFAQARDFIQGEGKDYNLVKYYMWSNCTGRKDSDRSRAHFKVAERFLQTVMKIPFVQRRVREFTGINTSRGHTEHHVLVDMSECADEGFTVLQLFRLAQEMTGHMQTYAHVLEETDNEWLAFALACQYSNCTRTPRTNGHIPTNNFSLAWWGEFITDPSIAKSAGDGWCSTVLCPKSARPHVNFETAKASLLKGDVPKHLVLVYGTLREGNGNHRIISEAKKAGGTVPIGVGYRRLNIAAKMYDTGCGFPALVPDLHSHSIAVEAYIVNDETFERLDRLEGYPHHYNRVQVEYAGEPAWVYVQSESKGYKEIKQGDWNAYVQGR